jgi:ankyrin repeat protein
MLKGLKKRLKESMNHISKKMEILLEVLLRLQQNLIFYSADCASGQLLMFHVAQAVKRLVSSSRTGDGDSSANGKGRSSSKNGNGGGSNGSISSRGSSSSSSSSSSSIKMNHYFLIAAAQGNTKKLSLLLQGQPRLVHQRDANNGLTALLVASHKGHEQAVRLLMEHSADVNAVDDFGWTALIHACRNGHSSVVALLLASKSLRINYADRFNCNAFMIACGAGHLACIVALAQVQSRSALGDGSAVGVAINQQSTYKDTALIFACKNGHTQVVQYLLSTFAPGAQLDLDVEGKHKQTALMRCGAKGHLELVYLLTAAGAKLYAQDGRGKTVLDYDSNGQLFAAIERGSRQLAARMLLKKNKMRRKSKVYKSIKQEKKENATRRVKQREWLNKRKKKKKKSSTERKVAEEDESSMEKELPIRRRPRSVSLVDEEHLGEVDLAVLVRNRAGFEPEMVLIDDDVLPMHDDKSTVFNLATPIVLSGQETPEKGAQDGDGKNNKCSSRSGGRRMTALGLMKESSPVKTAAQVPPLNSVPRRQLSEESMGIPLIVAVSPATVERTLFIDHGGWSRSGSSSSESPDYYLEERDSFGFGPPGMQCDRYSTATGYIQRGEADSESETSDVGGEGSPSSPEQEGGAHVHSYNPFDVRIPPSKINSEEPLLLRAHSDRLSSEVSGLLTKEAEELCAHEHAQEEECVQEWLADNNFDAHVKLLLHGYTRRMLVRMTKVDLKAVVGVKHGLRLFSRAQKQKDEWMRETRGLTMYRSSLAAAAAETKTELWGDVQRVAESETHPVVHHPTPVMSRDAPALGLTLDVPAKQSTTSFAPAMAAPVSWNPPSTNPFDVDLTTTANVTTTAVQIVSSVSLSPPATSASAAAAAAAASASEAVDTSASASAVVPSSASGGGDAFSLGVIGGQALHNAKSFLKSWQLEQPEPDELREQRERLLAQNKRFLEESLAREERRRQAAAAKEEKRMLQEEERRMQKEEQVRRAQQAQVEAQRAKEVAAATAVAAASEGKARHNYGSAFQSWIGGWLPENAPPSLDDQHPHLHPTARKVSSSSEVYADSDELP